MSTVPLASDLTGPLAGLSSAWAAWRESALNACFSAVMGSLLDRHLRFDERRRRGGGEDVYGDAGIGKADD